MVKKITLLVSIFFSLIRSSCFGQDIKGGEITIVTSMTPLHVDATVSLYVRTSVDVLRPYILLNWGDGNMDTLYSSVPQNLAMDTRLYTYPAAHDYSGYGTYILNCRDSFRIAGISNIDYSSSEEMFFATQITLNPFLGLNSTPVLTTYQASGYFAGNIVHNAGAYDPNGDSLSYSLVSCFTNTYTFPNAMIDPETGDFSMPVAGQDSTYQVVIRIDEWRRASDSQSYHMGFILRDMAIEVPLIIDVEENGAEVGCAVRPNPASEIVTFQFSDSQQPHTVVIYNPLGHEVWREEINEILISVSVHEFAEGIYFYSLIDEAGQSTTGKFIVAR